MVVCQYTCVGAAVVAAPANNKEFLYKGKTMTLHTRIPAMDPPATGFYKAVTTIDGVEYPSFYTIITGVACIGKRYAAYAMLYDLDGMQYDMGATGEAVQYRLDAQNQIPDLVESLVTANGLESCPQPYAI